MEKNIFTFNNQHWLQLLGTSMGSRVSPTWANLFMGVLEQKILQNCPQHLKQFILLWRRFIDDVIIIFTGDWQQFEEFFTYLFSKRLKSLLELHLVRSISKANYFW